MTYLKIFKEITKFLKENENKQNAEVDKRFFKCLIKSHGVRAGVLKDLAKKYYKIIDSLDKKEVFLLCKKLMETDYNEEFFISYLFCYRIHKQYEINDFEIFEDFIKNYINNWMKCDTFCNHCMGELIEKYPSLINKMKIWATSNNLYLRRALAVSFIVPARHGNFKEDVFEISDLLIKDTEDLVQKGYGWALKALTEKYPDEVTEFVNKRKEIMPKVAYNYALEKIKQKKLKLII